MPPPAKRADELFLDAVELTAEQREAFLQEHCGDDDALRREVESLLRHDGGAAFLDAGAIAIRAADVLESAQEPDQAIPPQFDGYRILRRIGQGGMATVYEARQESPSRLVAVKVVHAGPGTRHLQRRFQQEIAVLGQLNHPGIARIYGAGSATTAAGKLPYYAMELVRGPTLTGYAAEHELSVRERLALIAQICDAVQFAHDKGIIHRDLKPANILVSDEATGSGAATERPSPASLRRSVAPSPVPKILDFGVARIIEADVQMTVQRTNVAQVIGTIPYMSPEQIRGDSAAIDVRTDVYSLGVLLYELIAGRLPHDVRNRPLAAAAQLIQETEPTRLSSISTVFRGDVETLVAKALEKDPARRFQSARELAADIRRYLHDEPILARPASTLYQLRKFAKRNRALVTAVAVVLLSLIASTIVSARFAISELAQRRIAERRAHRANVLAASAELLERAPSRARALLEQSGTADRASWEWRHLNATLNDGDIVLHGHAAAVTTLAFLGDGRVVSGSEDQTLRIWSPDDDAPPLVLRGHDAAVVRVLDDPTRHRLVSAASDGRLLGWDVATGAVTCKWDCGAPLVDFDISPDGTQIAALLAVVRDDGIAQSHRVQIRRLDTLEVIREWRATEGFPMRGCRFSCDGSELFLTLGSGIDRRNVVDGRRIELYRGSHEDTAVDACVDESGTMLATCASDKQIVLWDAQQFAERRTLKGHTGPVVCIAFGRDERLLASGSNDQTVRLWDTHSGRNVQTLMGHAGAVRALAYSRDGRWLASASDDATVRLWRTDALESSRSPRVLTGHKGVIYDAAFLRGGDTVVTSGWDDQTIRLWNAASGETLRVFENIPLRVEHFAISHDGATIAMASWGLDLLDIRDGAQTRFGKVGGRARSVAFSTDDSRIFTTAAPSASRRATVFQVWDAATGKLLDERGLNCDSIVWNCGDRVLLAQLGEHEATVSDAADGTTLFTFTPPAGGIERLRASRDGLRCVAACLNGSAIVMDARSGKLLATLQGHTEKVYDAVFLPDGSRIATCSNDNSIRLWRCDTFEEVLELRGHERYVHGLAFNDSGDRLASVSGDGTVRIWSAVPRESTPRPVDAH